MGKIENKSSLKTNEAQIVNSRHQTIKNHLILLFLISLLLSLGGCAYQLTPSISKVATLTTPERIPYRILLRMPDDFTRFEYVASYESKEIRYRFGESVKQDFPLYLRNIFSSVTVSDLLREQKDYEFIATPQFTSTNSYVRPFVFGIEVGVKIDFISKDKSRIITVMGKGRGEANVYLKSTLLNAGEKALNEAILELRDQIFIKKELFRIY
jgi:hypothetical protein